jgi:hypothetical protein
MLQYEGRVPVGSGVAESDGRALGEVVVTEVAAVGVAAGMTGDEESGWVQPAKASASTRRSAGRMTGRRFMREGES